MEEIAARDAERYERAYSCYSLCEIGDEEREGYEHHVLLPVDDSQDSQDAVAWAARNVWKDGTMFHLLHTIPEPDTLHQWPGVYEPMDANKETEEFAVAEALMRGSFLPLLDRHNVPCDAHIIITPDDADAVTAAILQQAQRLGACLVVAAPHSKGRLQELWRGSVTHNLVAAFSKYPVCIVKSGTQAAAGQGRQAGGCRMS